jgi:hypothetical protein
MVLSFVYVAAAAVFLWGRVAVDAAASSRRRYAYLGAVGWSLGAGVAIAAAEDWGSRRRQCVLGDRVCEMAVVERCEQRSLGWAGVLSSET